MKNKIVLLLLCGLFALPATGWAAEAAIGAEALSALLEEAATTMSGAADRVSSALARVGDATADLSQVATQSMEAASSSLESLSGDLKGLVASQAEGVVNGFTGAFSEEASAIEAVAGQLPPGGDTAALVERLEDFPRAVGDSFTRNLEGLGLPEGTAESLSQSMDSALLENSQPIARTGTPDVAGGSSPDTVPLAAGLLGGVDVAGLADAVDDLAGAVDDVAEELGGGSASPVLDDVASTGEAAAGASSSPTPTAAVTDALGLTRTGQIFDLGAQIRTQSQALADLEESVVGIKADATTGNVSVGKNQFTLSGGKTQMVGGRAVTADGVLSPAQSTAVSDFLGGDASRALPSSDIQVTQAADGGWNVKAKVKGETVWYSVPKSSTMDLVMDGFNGDKGTFTLSADGKISFSAVGDKEFATSVNGSLTEATSQIHTLKSEITDLGAQRKALTNFYEIPFVAINDGLEAVGNYWADNSVRQIAKDTFFGGLEGIKKIWGLTRSLIEMMVTGIAFGIPSMVYQAAMQKAQQAALYDQITAVYNIAPNLSVQVPGSLISQTDPTQASTYLYVAVKPGSTGYGNTMSGSALESGSYYVVYQNGAQWGSTYATSPNAFGVWVNLNTGLIFMNGGIPYSDQTPFTYLMEPTNDATLQATRGAQTTLSVYNYTQQASGLVSGRSNYTYQQSVLDSLTPWNVNPTNSSIEANATLKNLFEAVESSQSTSAGSAEGSFNRASSYAPKLLVPTLNKFRQGIHGVTGFLPASSASTAPVIGIRQFSGTGILNNLLGAQSGAGNIEQSISMILALTASQPSSSAGAPSTNVLQALVTAQANLHTELADEVSPHYGNRVTAAAAALKVARSNLQKAIPTTLSANTNPGLDAAFDVNAYNIYLYETEDTPIVQFMKQHRASDLLPVKDYVVFLDNDLNIVPLFATGLIVRPSGIGVIDFDTTQINPNIQYMLSLVTGIGYLYSPRGAGSLVETLNNVPCSQYLLQTVMPALFAQIALVFIPADATNMINQILTMANYATNLSYQGPLMKNGCLFESVPLNSAYTDTVQQKINVITSGINGITTGVGGTSIAASGASTPAQQMFNTSGTPAVPAALPSLYVYKVSKLVNGVQDGVFGQDKNGNQICDYVVALAPRQTTNSSGSTVTYYQIIPLGMSAAVGDISGLSGAQILISLVTGQVYDSNYCLLTNPPYSATVIKRTADFNLVAASPGEYSVPFQQTASDGTVKTVQVAAVPNVPLATAFMPTFCNPYNVIYGSMQDDPTYTKDVAAVAAAQAQIASLYQTIQGEVDTTSSPTFAQNVWTQLQQSAQVPANLVAQAGQTSPRLITQIQEVSASYAQYLTLPGEPAGKPGKVISDMTAWANAYVASTQAQATLAADVKTFQESQKATYAPVAKTTDQMITMAPMYWMHFTQFAYAPQSSSMQQIQYNNPSQQQITVNINWMGTPNPSLTALGCSFAQAVPTGFLGDVVSAYNGWQEIMDSADGVAKIMQAGPFQFSQNMKYNVYLTLPPTNGVTDTSTGNFFYNMVPVALPNTLFAVGDLDPAVAASVTSNADKGVSSAVPSLTLAQCNTGSRLGASFLEVSHPVAIDLSSGDVWFPTPLGYSATCYNSKMGSVTNAQCNIVKIGTLDPQAVLTTALANQGSSLAEIQKTNPALYTTLMNCQALSLQKTQNSLTDFYFAGRLLSLCPEEIKNGTYIYAVDVTPENYYEATDYWVVIDTSFNPKGALTASTNYMISLVTGKVYEMNTAIQQTGASIATDITQGVGFDTIETPATAFDKLFGVRSYGTSVTATLLTPVQQNNNQLFSRIENLNQLENQNFIKQQFSDAANQDILTPQLPIAQLQKAAPVSALYNNLYFVNNKYYLKMAGGSTAPTYYYDFNAELQQMTPSATGGVPTYTSVPGNAQRGMYYMVQPAATKGAAPLVTSVSILTGYSCQAMLMRYGITINQAGVQTMGIPVYSPPLPMTAKDMAIAPGVSGDNMKCLSQPQTAASSSTVSETYVDYYYKNTASESYLVRRVLDTTVPVYDEATKSVQNIQETQDFYVDLMTGECYSPDGTPQLTPITVAYNFTAPLSSKTGLVPNNALDFSNPLFVWGELALLGESLQTNMLYQDTNATDPYNGYNMYQIQPGSSLFTLVDSTGKNQTVYAYGTDADTNGNLLITQNGKTMSPEQTNMSSVLATALSGGSTLLTKSYVMNVNGTISTGTPTPGSSVLVTETYVQPKQFMVSYTNADGSLTTDKFQVPVQTGAASDDPGKSPNLYNNPPLDDTLQTQLMQGHPFCANVFASCPYGQETVQNIDTKNLGTTGVTCGLLYQPKTTATFGLTTAGLLSAVFSGANPNGSTGAINGQYFAFYDSYNKGSANASGDVGASDVVPNKGQYGSYISVVSSMQNNALSPFPGIYAGNFNVDFTPAPPASGSASTTTTPVATYSSPYLRILGLTGTMDSSTYITSFSAPAVGSATEYFYKYLYNTVTTGTLSQLKSTVNISSNSAGFMELVSAVPVSASAGVSVTNPSANEAAAAVIQNQVTYQKLTNGLAQEPAGRYFYKLACGTGGSDAASGAATNGLCSIFFSSSSKSNPAGKAVYIDIYNGIVFQPKTTSSGAQLLYPIGFSISHDMRMAISQMIGGAVPAAAPGQLTIQAPLPGQGAPLAGQVVKAKLVTPTS